MNVRYVKNRDRKKLPPHPCVFKGPKSAGLNRVKEKVKYYLSDFQPLSVIFLQTLLSVKEEGVHSDSAK